MFYFLSILLSPLLLPSEGNRAVYCPVTLRPPVCLCVSPHLLPMSEIDLLLLFPPVLFSPCVAPLTALSVCHRYQKDICVLWMWRRWMDVWSCLSNHLNAYRDLLISGLRRDQKLIRMARSYKCTQAHLRQESHVHAERHACSVYSIYEVMHTETIKAGCNKKSRKSHWTHSTEQTHTHTHKQTGLTSGNEVWGESWKVSVKTFHRNCNLTTISTDRKSLTWITAVKKWGL